MERQGDIANKVVAGQIESPKRNPWTTIEIAVKGTSFVVLILLIVGLALDELNTSTGYVFDTSGDRAKVDIVCKWKEAGSDDVKMSYKDQCKLGGDDSAGCKVETIGEVWMAFGILGVLAQASAVLSMFLVLLPSIEITVSREAILRLAALGVACAFVLIQWSVWQAKGCHDYDNDWDLGPSMIVVIIAWVLSVLATALQLINTMSILRGSSNSAERAADLENGASIRS